MDRYNIYCTKEQTTKTLDLGAPIRTISYDPPVPPPTGWAIYKNNCCKPPTAEQMIGWLEGLEDINEISIIKSLRGWIFVVYVRGVPLDIEDSKDTFYPTRPEATLAAIDAALDYLSKNKK